MASRKFSASSVHFNVQRDWRADLCGIRLINNLSGEGRADLGEWKIAARIWKMTCKALALFFKKLMFSQRESSARKRMRPPNGALNLSKTSLQNLQWARCSIESSESLPSLHKRHRLARKADLKVRSLRAVGHALNRTLKKLEDIAGLAWLDRSSNLFIALFTACPNGISNLKRASR